LGGDKGLDRILRREKDRKGNQKREVGEGGEKEAGKVVGLESFIFTGRSIR